MSHKSYRPLTVISFRLSRQLWDRLPSAWTRRVSSWRDSSAGSFEDSNKFSSHRGKERPAGLDPLIFHAVNVVLHATSTLLVCR